MADEEKQDAVEEATDSEDSTAGPVPEEDSSSSQDDAAGDDSSSTPPADETPEAAEQPQDEAPAASSESTDAPAGAGGGDDSEEDALPWKEKRRLERSRRPHEAGPQLSVEERAAKRAEGRKAKAGLRRKQRAEARTGKGEARTGTSPAERTPNAAKVRQGIVVSDKGEKTITVRIDIVRRHPTYEKVVRSSRTLHAHDEQNEANAGDVVRVVETRPLSKTKRWRLVDVIERAR